MADRYENIRKALADMDAAAEARNALARRDAHAMFVVHVAPDTIRELLAERDQLAAALEAAREDAERYRALRDALLDDESEAWEAFMQQPEPKNAADFDAAIDQARGKEVQDEA